MVRLPFLASMNPCCHRLEVRQNYDAITQPTTSRGAGFDGYWIECQVALNGATVNVGADGSFTYNPGSQFNYLGGGSSVVDSFTYTVEDSSLNTDSATVFVTVNGALTIHSVDITLDNTLIAQKNLSGAVVGNLAVVDPDTGEFHLWTVNDAVLRWMTFGQLQLGVDRVSISRPKTRSM